MHRSLPPIQESLRAMATQFAAAATPGRRLVTIDLPGTIVDHLAAGGLPSLRSRATVTWEKPSGRSALIGLGTAARLDGERASSLSDSIAPIVALSSAATVQVSQPSARPRFFGGGRFDPAGEVEDRAWDSFGGWQFVVPCFLLATEDGSLLGSCTLGIDDSDTAPEIEARLTGALERALRPEPLAAGTPRARTAPGPQEWEAQVTAAIAEIASGEYQKVVLARRIGITPSHVDAGEALTNLALRYGNCYVFKFHTEDADWLGATPELLVALESDAVRAASLAGSRPRNPERGADRQQTEALLADSKERAEHEYVVAALREALTPMCADLSAPAGPEIMTLANIHHLYTPFAGHVASGTRVLDLVAAIHPTPAVGGWPRAEAMAAINRLEQMDRGWYSGPIGWIDFDGDGEFAVALRAGLVSSTEAVLFAGAGIVAGSVPADELAETETKLRPLRDALGDR